MKIDSLIDENGVLELPKEVVLDGLAFTLEKIGLNSFDNKERLRELRIPSTVRKIEWCFYECFNLERIIVDEENPNYASIDGVLYSKDHKRLVAYPNAHGEEYHILDGTKEIARLAFKTCKDVKRVYLPESLKKIGINAFYRCDNLEKVFLPDNIRSIGAATQKSRYEFMYVYRGLEYTRKDILELLPK